MLLYHLARLRKLDLGAHIFEFIKELAIDVDPQRTIQFSCLISGLYLSQRVPIFSNEKAEPPIPLLNAPTVKNSKTKIAAGGNRVPSIPAVAEDEDEDYHNQAPSALPPVWTLAFS
ncbi:hypothetical protein Adt_45725 [Abeliophyllum distichum]|uniref:Uncharacterized protein n=1 Tax=Abeliophyllum distichum TaxID=126358 RepID=A0ABD1PEH4_9LAMI